ncbi:FadR/GntR family transcriptional regulator [Ilumatobacter sp.]|uniref:FadR/GntR family transcriptional regulator n=1 Tax=Ilumatobacter sp. TaxID=1967498 RepID=UPI0037514BF8
MTTKDSQGQAGGIPEAMRHRKRPIRTPKTALLVAQRIVDEITSGGLESGAMLASEKEMLDRYEVGRGTLRESLRFLEMNGVITIKPGPGGGPTVCEPDSRDLAGALGLFLQLHGTPFSAIVEVRQLLEPAIAALAATKMTDEHAAELKASVDSMEVNLDVESEFLAENERFHELVAWASDNAMFASLIASLHWITDGAFLGVDYPRRRREAVVAAHRRIYEALTSGDPDKASEAMGAHIDEFAKYLKRYYPAVFASPLSWTDIAR